MIIALATQFYIYLLWGQPPLSIVSVIVKTDCEMSLPAVYPGHGPPVPGSPMSVRSGLVPSSPYLTMRPHPHHLHHQQYIQVQWRKQISI